MFHVERMVVCRAAAPLVLTLVLCLVAFVQPFWAPCWACVGAGKSRLVRVLVAWSLCVGWGFLALSPTLVDVVDTAQHAARRARHSWPLVPPREVTALPRSVEGYPSVL